MTFSQYLGNVPTWLLFYVGFILVAFTTLLLLFLRNKRQLSQLTDEANATFARMGSIDDLERQDGRRLAGVDQWRTAYRNLTGPSQQICEIVDNALVVSSASPGDPRFKIRDTAANLVSETRYVAAAVNFQLLDSVPSILTALGLIGTFVAIAIGLGGLQPDAQTEVVKGVAALVAGLSGKFITSIVALALSLVFQFVDAATLRPAFKKDYERFCTAVDKAFPVLSTSQQIAALLETGRKQERSLANISSDIVDRFSDVFASDLLPQLGTVLAASMQHEMAPALGRVADGLAALESGINRLESGKQESIGEELRGLTQSIEVSLRTTLQQMGTQFREALSGAAGGEFDNASKALEASAEVLRGMNSSFNSMQSSLERLLADAESRTSKAFDEGEGRTRALNDLIERLVGQLNDSASSSAGEIQRLLVEAVSGLGGKFSQFSSEMEERIRKATEAGAKSSTRFVTEATEAAGRSSAEAERVLVQLGARIDDFNLAASQLKELREGVERVLAETGNNVRHLHDSVGAFRTVATEASTMAKSLRETQDQQRRTAETAAGTVTSVGVVVQEQSKLLGETRGTFDQARSVFSELDTQLASALTAVVKNMQDYNEQVEQNFERIMRSVNEKMPELHERLEGSIGQLTEQVGELTEVLGQQQLQRSR